MARKLPDTDSNEGQAFERAYQYQVAKQRAVIPHITAEIIKQLFLNPDQAFPRLHELLLERSARGRQCDDRATRHLQSDHRSNFAVRISKLAAMKSRCI